MGDFLSTPDKTKHSTNGQTPTIAFGASSMQGWRKANEDAHLHELDILKDGKMHLFAVFDGHGGHEVAEFAAKHFLTELKKNYSFKEGDYEKGLRDTFILIDKKLITEEGKKDLARIAKKRQKD
jgi:serine/threonine protein phosphatase PrpC